MKKVEENKFPNSATLFKFCKEALELRYEGNVKVIDQDVGAILGYDPADCSHWKKGKKNIRALPTLRSIADHLKIDERLLIDITAGRIGIDEAIFEFKGYGEFNIAPTKLEHLKKEFFKTPNKWNNTSDNDPTKFDKIFSIHRDKINRLANQIIKMGDFKEAPIYIPEVLGLFNHIKLENNAQISHSFEVQTNGDSGATTVFYKTDEVKPFIRFIAARELFKSLLVMKHDLVQEFEIQPETVIEIQANIFASHLLVPDEMLKTEVIKVDHTMDIVTQLANTFWISRSLMNKRLQDYLINIK